MYPPSSVWASPTVSWTPLGPVSLCGPDQTVLRFPGTDPCWTPQTQTPAQTCRWVDLLTRTHPCFHPPPPVHWIPPQLRPRPLWPQGAGLSVQLRMRICWEEQWAGPLPFKWRIGIIMTYYECFISYVSYVWAVELHQLILYLEYSNTKQLKQRIYWHCLTWW